MRIALNALYVGDGVAGGRVYRDGLLSGLSALGTGCPYTFDVYTRRAPDLPALPPDRFRTVEAPVSGTSTLGRTAWEYAVLPRRVRRGGYAAYHALGSLSPRVRKVPVVLTIHDLIYRHFPESVPLGYRLFMRTIQPRAARRADRVIVDSQHVAREVVEILGVRPDRVRVVYLGAGHGFAPVFDRAAVEAVLTRYGARPPYLVAVGRGYPHKNVAGLLRAFAVLRRKVPEVQLVLVGERYRAASELDRLLAELNLGGSVVWTGFASRADLSALYTAAAAFAFPSLAEGFGLPPLEAMACGTPVVASDLTAIPEVVGDAGVLADPRNPEAFAAALESVLGSAELRAELARRGRQRAAEFTWEKCAEQTLNVYRELT
jgi:glycosyltransferase involved in cell wall biosynthesis